jgi:hypothetical protein
MSGRGKKATFNIDDELKKRLAGNQENSILLVRR